MSDLISKSELLKKIDDVSISLIQCRGNGKTFIRMAYERAFNQFYEMVKSMPTVEQKHGHWNIGIKGIENEEMFADIPFCSNCHIGTIKTYDYCPHCGAKMDEEVEK